MTFLYLLNLVLGGVLLGSGLTSGDNYYVLAGSMFIVFNLLPFIPWKDETLS